MNVSEVINTALWADLAPEIAGIPTASTVGEAVVELLNRVETVIEFDDDMGEEAQLEPDVRQAFITTALRQCRVWYFG